MPGMRAMLGAYLILLPEGYNTPGPKQSKQVAALLLQERGSGRNNPTTFML